MFKIIEELALAWLNATSRSPVPHTVEEALDRVRVGELIEKLVVLLSRRSLDLSRPVTAAISWEGLTDKETITALMELEAQIRSASVEKAIGENGVRRLLAALQDGIDARADDLPLSHTEADEAVLMALQLGLNGGPGAVLFSVIREAYRVDRNKRKLMEGLLQLAHSFELGTEENKKIRHAVAQLMDRKSYLEYVRRLEGEEGTV